ncbi:MAG: NAD(P)-dependent oxidoreductase [Xanthobacteraceae bacterium]|nr:NAD(P)-dependent oxidoreductase [Xanthobacteraceae bacterium]
MPHVAFIGLGRMGQGMAGRYLDAGFTLAVWNRSRHKADALIARGAHWAATPAEAARDADAIVTMVADDATSRAVWTGKDGIAETARKGALAIECSTVSYRHAVDMARDLAARGLHYIDCPVTGVPTAAAAGQLTLLVGADAGDLDAARAFLDPLGPTVRHFGAAGAGTVYKLINNLLGAVQIASLAEGLRIAEQAGLDMRLVQRALASGAVASPQVVRHSARMVARDFASASFTAALRHKDASYALALADNLGLDLNVSRAALDSYARAAADAPDEDEGRLIEIIKARPE